MIEKSHFTTKEAANFLGVSQSTIYRMERNGLIYSIRTPGGQRRFSRESIENYLNNSSIFEAPQNPSKYKK
jgi:excisionase family DNA binding protein